MICLLGLLKIKRLLCSPNRHCYFIRYYLKKAHRTEIGDVRIETGFQGWWLSTGRNTGNKIIFGLLFLILAMTIRVKSCNILLSWRIFWENLGIVPFGLASELSNGCVPQLMMDLWHIAIVPWTNSRDTLCSSAKCFLLFYEKLLVNKISYISLKDWQMRVKCKRACPFL